MRGSGLFYRYVQDENSKAVVTEGGLKFDEVLNGVRAT
jgi:hypothetical protein